LGGLESYLWLKSGITQDIVICFRSFTGTTYKMLAGRSLLKGSAGKTAVLTFLFGISENISTAYFSNSSSDSFPKKIQEIHA